MVASLGEQLHRGTMIFLSVVAGALVRGACTSDFLRRTGADGVGADGSTTTAGAGGVTWRTGGASAIGVAGGETWCRAERAKPHAPPAIMAAAMADAKKACR